MDTDIIEKKVLLRASRKRVWLALSDSTEFGTWFGMRFNGPFAPGARMNGVIVPTTVNAEVARAQKPYEGTAFDITIEQMEPERLFSFRWHPGAIDPGVDYSVEPTTLVAFVLEASARRRSTNDYRVWLRSDPARAPGEGVHAERARLDHGREVDRGAPWPAGIAHDLLFSRPWAIRPAYG